MLEEIVAERGYRDRAGRRARRRPRRLDRRGRARALGGRRRADGDPAAAGGRREPRRAYRGAGGAGAAAAQIGVVARAEGAALAARLKPGQRLVSREGDLWRWDGFAAAAEAPTPGRAAAGREEPARRPHRARARRRGSDADALKQDAARLAGALRDAAAAETRRAAARARGARRRRRARAKSCPPPSAAARRPAPNSPRSTRALARATRGARRGGRAAQRRRRGHAGAAAGRRARRRSRARPRQRRRRRARAMPRPRRSPATSRASWNRAPRAAAPSPRSGAPGPSAAPRRRRISARSPSAAAAPRRNWRRSTRRPAEFALQRRALMSRAQRGRGRAQTTAADARAAAETRLAEADRAARAALEAMSSSREQRAAAEQRRRGRPAAGARTLLKPIAAELETEPHGLHELAGVKRDEPTPPLEAIEKRLENLKLERERLGAVNLRADEELAEIEALARQDGGRARRPHRGDQAAALGDRQPQRGRARAPARRLHRGQQAFRRIVHDAVRGRRGGAAARSNPTIRWRPGSNCWRARRARSRRR